MDYTELGSTGLRVSVAGLGCGGSSRLGLGYGRSEGEAAAVVRRAFDLGVNFFDTAMAYGTETAVGMALRDLPRSDVVVSTKSQLVIDGQNVTPEGLLANLDASLTNLGLDHVDVFHLHGVRPAQYELALSLYDALSDAKSAGKLRHIGITETGPFDPTHQMLGRATLDPRWEVVMAAFHMLNQNTRRLVFPNTIKNRIGTLIMFAVRAIFSRPERLAAAMRALGEAGKIPPEVAKSDDPLGFLIHADGAQSLIDAAYRYVRHEPGADVILFGTGDPEHVEANVRSLLRPPLPETDRARLDKLFGHLEGVGLDLPSGSK